MIKVVIALVAIIPVTVLGYLFLNKQGPEENVPVVQSFEESQKSPSPTPQTIQIPLK